MHLSLLYRVMSRKNVVIAIMQSQYQDWCQISEIKGFHVSYPKVYPSTRDGGWYIFSMPETLVLVHVIIGKMSLTSLYLSELTIRMRIRILRISVYYAVRGGKVAMLRYLLGIAPECALTAGLTAVNYSNSHEFGGPKQALYIISLIPLTHREYISTLRCAIKRGELIIVCGILDVIGIQGELIVKAFFTSISNLERDIFDEFIRRGVDVHYPHRGTAYRVARNRSYYFSYNTEWETYQHITRVLGMTLSV